MFVHVFWIKRKMNNHSRYIALISTLTPFSSTRRQPTSNLLSPRASLTSYRYLQPLAPCCLLQIRPFVSSRSTCRLIPTSASVCPLESPIAWSMSTPASSSSSPAPRASSPRYTLLVSVHVVYVYDIVLTLCMSRRWSRSSCAARRMSSESMCSFARARASSPPRASKRTSSTGTRCNALSLSLLLL